MLPGSLVGQRAGGGLWTDAALGPGWARLGCEICEGGRTGGLAARLGLGGWATPRLRIGARLNAWTTDADGVRERVVVLAAVAGLRPSPPGRVHLEAGAGYASYRADDDVDVVSASGVGVVLGASYEWPVGSQTHLGPFASLVVAPIGGQLSLNGDRILSSASVALLQFGLTFSWR